MKKVVGLIFGLSLVFNAHIFSMEQQQIRQSQLHKESVCRLEKICLSFVLICAINNISGHDLSKAECTASLASFIVVLLSQEFKTRHKKYQKILELALSVYSVFTSSMSAHHFFQGK